MKNKYYQIPLLLAGMASVPLSALTTEHRIFASDADIINFAVGIPGTGDKGFQGNGSDQLHIWDHSTGGGVNSSYDFSPAAMKGLRLDFNLTNISAGTGSGGISLRLLNPFAITNGVNAIATQLVFNFDGSLSVTSAATPYGANVTATNVGNLALGVTYPFSLFVNTAEPDGEDFTFTYDTEEVTLLPGQIALYINGERIALDNEYLVIATGNTPPLPHDPSLGVARIGINAASATIGPEILIDSMFLYVDSDDEDPVDPEPVEPWRSALYPEDWSPETAHAGVDFRTDMFIQDFSYAGYHRGERPIPHVAGPVFNAIDYGADPTGQTDSTLAIQAAIDAAAAAGGGVAYIPEGQYQISRRTSVNYALRISTAGVVLRGAGPDRTFLTNTSTNNMRGVTVIMVSPQTNVSWTLPQSTPISITEDYTAPTRRIRLATTAGLTEGQWIAVHNYFTDQVDPVNGSFVQDLLMHGPGTPNWLGAGSSLHGPIIYRQITRVIPDENMIEIDAPTRWLLLQRDGARIYAVGTLMQEVGVEGFSIGNLRHPSTELFVDANYTVAGTNSYEIHGSYLIQFNYLMNSWLRDVHSFDPGNSNGVHMLSMGFSTDWSRNLTVKRVSMQKAQFGGGGGNGYMIRLASVNDVLVEDCYAGYCRHGYVMWRMQNSGNVVRNSMDTFSGYQVGNTGVLQPTAGRGSDHHGQLSHSNLFDSHMLDGSYLEAAWRSTSGSPAHAQTSSQSLFWNNIGINYRTGFNYIVHSQQFGHGYVIGTTGPASGVNTGPKYINSEVYTNPLDLVEGEKMGEGLMPQSIYEDQLLKRLVREGLPPAPWQGAEIIDTVTWNIPGFGYFHVSGELAFAYHYESGWLYFHGRDVENIILYSMEEDAWYWTNRYILPWAWGFANSEWVEPEI